MRGSIDAIGNELVQCAENCKRVAKDRVQGILPRCLIFELGSGKRNCVVVGSNPGSNPKYNPEERAHYIKNDRTYESEKSFFSNRAKDFEYFSETRRFLQGRGFDGHILWTDLVKCELEIKGDKSPPIQTIRTCTSKFLRQELEVDKESPIITLGNLAFDFCAHSFPDRVVIGLYHTTGSRGDYRKLVNAIEAAPKDFEEILANPFDEDGRPIAIHLSKIYPIPRKKRKQPNKP